MYAQIQAQQNVNEAAYLLQNNVDVAMAHASEIKSFTATINFFVHRGNFDRVLKESEDYKQTARKWLGIE